MIIHLLPEIEKPIWNKVGDHKKSGLKKEKQGRHHNNCKVSDDVILSMRRMHEVDRKSMAQVGRAYPQFSEDYVRSVLNYIIRCNLLLTSGSGEKKGRS